MTVAAPNGLREHVGFGQCAFAVAPGDFFDGDNATAATVDAPHGVQKEDEKTPQGDELEAPFGELVVAGRRLMAARAARLQRGHRARIQTEKISAPAIKSCPVQYPPQVSSGTRSHNHTRTNYFLTLKPNYLPQSQAHIPTTRNHHSHTIVLGTVECILCQIQPRKSRRPDSPHGVRP